MSAIEKVIEISKSGYELIQEEDWYELLDEVKELMPELAELRKDSERLEWLKSMMSGKTQVFIIFDLLNSIKPWGTYRKRAKRPKPLERFEDFNAAIDAAMLNT